MHVSRDEDIIVVNYLEGADIDVEIKKEMHEAYLKITSGVPHLFLFEAQGNFWLSRDAREYAAAIEPKQPFKAVAIVAKTLAYLILAYFYAKFYKPIMHYRVFKNREDALKWLKEHES